MEKYSLEEDIKVFCVTAKSFPDGVMEAHQTLHSKLSTTENRRFFGISYPNKGTIIYKAAAEELYDGEGEHLDCETFTIKKGEYISIFIPDFSDDVHLITKAFKELLAYPQIDPNGYCLEMYLSPTAVRCMVGIIEKES